VQLHAQLYTRRFEGYSSTTGGEIPGAHADSVPAAHSFSARLYIRRFDGYSNAREIPGAHADSIPAAHSFSGSGQEIPTCKTSCPPDVSPGGLKTLILHIEFIYTLVFVIRLPHANLSAIHTTLNTYYNDSKTCMCSVYCGWYMDEYTLF
jgi:hypothetical protein